MLLRVIGIIVFLISIPAFYSLVRSRQRYRQIAWFMLGFLPIMIGALHLDVSIISWATWPGYVKGLSVSLLDSLALALVLTTREPARGRPLLVPFVIFLFGTAVAIAFATPAMASFFFTWQLARALLLFVAVSMVASRPERLPFILWGLAASIAFQGIYSLSERMQGVTQAAGTMGHQNLLGLCCHFALLMSLSGMLAGDRRWWVKAGVVGGMVAVVLTGSRATTGLAGAGVVLLIVLSLIRRPNAIKMRVTGTAVAALLIGVPIALATLQARFERAPIAGAEDERAAFERAAKAIWSDHPMGVGANQYVVVANTAGYSERAGVIWNWTSRSANVHNTYLLLGAETGYLGLGSFLLLLISAMVQSLRLAWAKPRDRNGEYALGAFVTLLVVALHCLYEWVFVTWIVQYLFAVTLGIIAGVSKQQQVAARRRRDLARLPSRELGADAPELAPLPA